MENISEPTKDFDFSQLHLENPSPLQGGTFFTKLNFSNKQLPLYVQLPKSVSKHGFTTNSSKKSFIDLLFPYFETDLLEWFENLEIKCRELIFEKKDIWFQSEIDLDDIENMFISPAKPYKSGKFLSVRAQTPNTKQIKRNYCMIYDESENVLDASSINENTEMIPLVKIEGIKFSSKSFQLEINLPQLMVLNMDANIKKACVIKHERVNSTNINENNLDVLKDKETLEELKELKENDISNEEIEPNKQTDYNEENDEKGENEEFNLKSKYQENDDKIKEENDEYLEENDNNKKMVDLSILEEVDLLVNDSESNIDLKKPDEIYYEIYRVAREKAKHMKQVALEAHLEARNIKTKYMLNDLNYTDDEENEISETEE